MFEIKQKAKLTERPLLIGAFTEAANEAHAQSLLQELEELVATLASRLFCLAAGCSRWSREEVSEDKVRGPSARECGLRLTTGSERVRADAVVRLIRSNNCGGRLQASLMLFLAA
jgi:hypothetical protein